MEQSQIKGNKSKYYKKSENKTIETISKYINLGVNSSFAVNDNVCVLSESEYQQLTDKANDNPTDEIANLTANLESLKATNQTLSEEVTNSENKISELQHLIHNKDKELAKYNAIDINKLQAIANELETSNKKLLAKVTNRDEYIIYLELLQTDYKLLVQYLNTCLTLSDNRNLINRVINKDVASDIDKPQLEMMDLKGNVSDKANAPVIDVGSDKPNKSE